MQKILKYKYLLIIPLVLISLLSIYLSIPKTKAIEEEIITEPCKEEVIIKVDIKGAVVSPGVYELKEKSRVIDAINISGGFKENADTTTINLSKLVKDEDVIIVYTKEEIAKIQEGNVVVKYIDKECVCPKLEESTACVEKESSSLENNSLININSATLEELTKLPSIGESKAKEIIEYRAKTPFTKVEDIKNISGIGDATYNKLKDLIEV